MEAINTLTLYNCTKASPFTFPAVTCPTFSLLTGGKHGNVPLHQIHTFTKFDGRGAYHFWSTSLKTPLCIPVIQLYYTLDKSGWVCPWCCRLISMDTYATRTMHALSTLELRGGPDHDRAICLTLIAPFIKHVWKLAKLCKTRNKLVPRIQSGHLR